MRKISLLMLLTVAALALAACSAPAASSGTTGDAAASTAADGLPLQLELALGTLELEGTEQAVSPEQAAILLPLWQAVQTLPGLDTTAPAEIEALYTQIRDTMTPEQLNAIAALNLTPTSIDTAAAELGLSLGGPAGAGPDGAAPSAEMQATRAARRASGAGQGNPGAGGMPGDGFPGAGGPPPDLAGEANDATRGTTTRRSGGSSPFIQAVITLLEQKTQ
jgi:hypothetical protein